MTPNVPTIEMGTATLGMMVAERLRRKRNMTMTTRATVRTSVNSTSRTDALMVVVRSVRVVISMEDGSEALSCGKRRWMRSTTPMRLDRISANCAPCATASWHMAWIPRCSGSCPWA